MVEGIPEVFRTTGKNVATYDWKELAQDNAMITLYGCSDQTVSGCFLTSQTLYSDKLGAFAYGNTDGNYHLDMSPSFDLTINKAITLKGDSVFEIPLTVSGTNNHTYYVYAIPYIEKISGGVTTHVISGASAVIVNARTTSDVFSREKIVIVKLTTPQTIFKKGDTLRARIEVWSKTSAGGTQYPVIAYDPKNRPANDLEPSLPIGFVEADITTLKVNLPVKIDI